VIAVQKLAGPPGWHEIHKVIACDDCVVVIGRFIRPGTRTDIEFTDVLTLSDKALLLHQKRFQHLCGPTRA
jgi:hypothetical protein